MEIEELQAAWLQMSTELKKQKKLTDDIILSMTKEKYQNKFKKISTYETIGAIVCFSLALLVLIKFHSLDTWYLQICGLLTLIFLIVLPVLVLKTLNKMKMIDISKGSYKENLSQFLKTKNSLLKLQKLAIGISFFGLSFIVPVTSKIISNKDVFLISLKIEQYIAMGIAMTFVYFVSRLGYIGYKKVTNSAEELIKDLE
ncbi:hypothetical protein [uncultured Maribacter sp.]|uniref:hypothetical protein n=1 Tax=uncultured Maribacter sp. TaxID=431308 RepID=UPI0030DB17DF